MQFTHVFATGCCPTVCPVPEGPEAQLTKIFVLCWALRRRSEGKKEGSRATTVWPNRAVRMRKYCRLPTAVLCVLLPLSLSLIQRGREGQSLSHGHVFLLSHFFQSFSYLWRTDSKEKRMNHEEEEEKQIVWMRVMIFIMITQPKPLLCQIQMSALCSQDSDLQFDLTWDHMWLWFVGEAQVSHCILKLKTTDSCNMSSLKNEDWFMTLLWVLWSAGCFGTNSSYQHWQSQSLCQKHFQMWGWIICSGVSILCSTIMV